MWGYERVVDFGNGERKGKGTRDIGTRVFLLLLWSDPCLAAKTNTRPGGASELYTFRRDALIFQSVWLYRSVQRAFRRRVHCFKALGPRRFQHLRGSRH